MANGELLNRLADSRLLERLAPRVAVVADRLRDTLNRAPTPEEIRTEIARDLATNPDPDIIVDMNLERPQDSRIIQGTQLSFSGLILAGGAIYIHLKSGAPLDMSFFENVAIAVPGVLGLLGAVLGNALALFGRRAAAPAQFVRTNPLTWFARQ